MEQRLTVNHLAGIVPIASPDSFFNMPWHDCLMPLTEDLLAIENAVFNCALAGCDSIWVVCHMDTQPLVRKRLGEMIIDPVTHYSSDDFKYTRHDKGFTRREIQIYYVPIHSKDRDRKDSLGYSILYGLEAAMKVCSSISYWATPEKAFCAFPYGITPYEIIYNNRKNFRLKTPSIITYENKTIKDNLMLPFAFTRKDLVRCRERLKEYSINIWENRDNTGAKTLKFSLEEIFNVLDFSDARMIESPWYHQIDNWQNYKKFLSSDESQKIKKLDEIFLKTKRTKFNFEENND